MKIFLAPNIEGPSELLLQEQLVQELRKLHVVITTSIEVKKRGIERGSFEDYDAVIIDGGSKDPESGYFLAIALAHKKPVLYLLKKGEIIDSSIDALSQNPDVKKFIRIVFYTTDSLVRKVKAFLQYLDQSIGKEQYTIKYTLRLSPRLDRYIDWKSEKTKKNKADLIRDLVDESLKSDEEFKNRLQ